MHCIFVAILLCAGCALAGPASLERYPRDGNLKVDDTRPFNINELTSKDLRDLDPKNRECVCGARNEEDRIIGGRSAGKGEFPWRCGMFYEDPAEGMSLFCGCTVVSEEYVLTAAHCTYAMEGRQIFVDVGDYDITTKNDTKNEVLKVSKVIQNEKYNHSNHDWDVSLLKLESPLEFGRTISPVCLPWNLTDESYRNATVVASGSGATQEGGKISPILRTVDLPLISTEDCRDFYGHRITDNMICTYSPGKDTCQGDSGSSIDLQDPSSKQYFAVGVVSWGRGCARQDQPGVYAKVINFLRWIELNASGASFCKP